LVLSLASALCAGSATSPTLASALSRNSAAAASGSRGGGRGWSGGRRPGDGRVGAGASPGGGAGNGVGTEATICGQPGVSAGALVEVEHDAGVSRAVAVEVEVSWWGGGATAGDLDLNAGGVELGAASLVRGVVGIGFVEGNDLLLQEVTAGCQAAGEGGINFAAVGDHAINGPRLGSLQTILTDLCPDSASWVSRVIRGNPA
jgi:hypothetical protein